MSREAEADYEWGEETLLRNAAQSKSFCETMKFKKQMRQGSLPQLNSKISKQKENGAQSFTET